MKNTFLLLCGALCILTSCGISSRYSSTGDDQRFSDAIYSSSPSRKDKDAEQTSKEKLQNLTQKTQASQIYVYGDYKDTVVIPENMAAYIKYDKFAGTSITVADFNPYDYGYYLYGNRHIWDRPWYYGGYYSRWHSPWYYGGLHNPWYYSSWYDPWYYGGFYDPWYYSGFYDPWYYGYAGWYDPFYHYMRPHYHGWYGGWGPSHHHHHHVSYPSGGNHHGKEVYRGSRVETSKPQQNSRQVVSTSRNSFGTSRTASTRQVQGRSSATYRRPAGTTTSRATVSGSSSSTYNRSSSSNSSTVYNRSTSSQSRSYSSPSSSTRSSYSSGSSGGGYSRSSSSGGGGGYSRSSSGTRR